MASTTRSVAFGRTAAFLGAVGLATAALVAPAQAVPPTPSS